MRIYTIAAPNGRTYEIEGPDGASEAQVIAALLAQDPSAGQPAPARKPGSVTGELVRGVRQLGSSARTALGAVTGSADQAAAAGVDRAGRIAEEAGEGPSLQRVRDVFAERGLLPAGRQVLSDIPQALAGQAGTLATMFAGGKAGALAGARFGPKGALIGGGVGAATALLPTLTGSNLERQAAEQIEAGEPVDTSLGRAAVAATGQAALETAGTGLVLGKRVIGRLLGLQPAQLATDAAKARLVQEASRTLAGGVARGVAIEMPVEIAQSVIERAQAGLDVTSDDAFKEYGEAAYLASLVGGPLGGAGTAVSRRRARAELAEEPPAAPEPGAAAAPGVTEWRDPEYGPAPTPPDFSLKTPAEMSAGELILEEARLSALLAANRRQPEVVERIREVRALKAALNLSDAEAAVLQREAQTAQAAREQALAQQSVFSQPELPEVTPRESIDPAAEVVTPELLAQVGLSPTSQAAQQVGVREWARANILGKSLDDVRALVQAQPKLTKGAGLRARMLKELLATAPAPFVEAPRASVPPTVGVPESAEPVAGRREPGVAVPDAGDAERGSPAAAAGAGAPAGRGVAPAGRTAAPRVVAEGAAPPAVAPALPAPAPLRERVREVLDPDKATPAAVKALEPYTARMEAEGAGVPDLPRYLGWDMMSGSTYDPQTREFSEVGFRPEKGKGTTAAQARAVYDALPPAAQQQVQDEARRYFELERAAQQAAERRDRQAKQVQQEQAEGEVDLADMPDDYGLDILAARRERRPTVTETPTGRRVEGIRYADTPAQETPLADEVRSELEAGNVVGALNALAQTTTDPMYAQIAQRLMLLLGNTSVTLHPDLRNADGDPVAGAASTSGRRIWLDLNRGMNEETLLHESVHAATESVLAMPEAQRTAQQNEAVRQLNALWEAAKADDSINLSPPAAAQLSEFVTEAMTSQPLVAALKAKPWAMRDAWDGFKRILLRMLGVDTPRTMQDAVVAAMDTIFTRPEPLPAGAAPVAEGVRNQAAPPRTAAQAPAAPPMTVAQTLKAMRPGPQQNSLKAMLKGAFGSAGTGPAGAANWYVADAATKVRTKLTDRAATVFDALMEAVDRGMISEMESRRTQVAFKQGEASDQMTPEFMRRGGIERNPVGGWRAVAPKGKRPPVDVFPLVEKWGKARGLSMEDAWADAARLIESGRQYEFRAANRKAKPDDPKLPVSMTDAQIDTLYPAYKADKDLAEVKKILDDARFRLIDQMVDVGRLSKAEGQIWKAASEYVPFDRLTDLSDRLRQQKNVGRGLASLGGLPKLVDAAWVDRPVGNALENYFGTLGWMMEQVVRTDAVNKTVEQLHKIKQAEPRGFNAARIADRSRAVRTYRDGREYWYEVPSIYHAVAFNTTTAPLPGFARVFGTISRVLRTSVTAIPTFPLTQLPMDIQRAILSSGVKDPLALSARALNNFRILGDRALRGKLPTATPAQSEVGLVGDVDFRANDPARSLLEEYGYASPTLLKSKTAGRLLHRMNELSRASDIAIRKAIYDQTMLETKDELLAMQRAREIINFRTTGSGDPLHILPFAIQTIPFFNAFVQGTDVLYRGITGKNAASGLVRKQALARFYTMAGSLAAVSSLYALAMTGEEEYENMDLEKRDRTWVLGNGVALPVPNEIGILFKAIPERVVDAFKNGPPDQRESMQAISAWFRAALGEYGSMLNPMPAAIRPVIEAWGNFSMRTGRELEGAYQEGLLPSERVTANTSEFAREVARFAKAALDIEVSPIKIDNTLNGYFGTTAAMTLATMDALTSDRADRPLHRIVGLTRFTYDPVGTRNTSDFYDLRKEVVQAQNTLNMLFKQSPERAMRFAEENKEKLMVYKAVNATLKQLQQTRDYKNWLDTSTAAQQMSADERMRKKTQVQQWEQQLVAWSRDARKALAL